MIEQQNIEAIVAHYLEEYLPDYYVVEVVVHVANRIVVELGCDAGVDIDACVALTKHIESQQDREIEDYELEVGSAGLTSPFKVLRQYQGAIGQEIEVLVRGGIKETGILKSVTEEGIVLSVTRMVRPEGAKRKQAVEEELSLPLTDILQAKRVLKFK